MIGSGLQFCAHCDYAISRIEMDSYRGDLDKTMCPRCGMCRLSMFYSYGSQCHINRREAWERGEVTGAPLPVPNATITGGDSRPVHGLVGDTNHEDRT